MAKLGKGVGIVQRQNGSWRVQIRKKGFPYQTRDFLSHAEADEWAIAQLSTMQETGRLVDFRPARETTLGDVIELYIAEVTAKRPAETSRTAEEARLRRFARVETFLCDHAVAHITPKQIEEWRDRRLTEQPTRGKEGGRGRFKGEVPKGRLRADGTPRKNAAAPKVQKDVGLIKPGTVQREMTLLKRVFDFAMRKFDLRENPFSRVDRVSANDERSVRIDQDQFDRLLEACRAMANPWIAPIVEFAWEVGARRSSILRLEWRDINLRHGCVTLRRVKNSRKPSEIRDVEVGLTPRAIEILKSLPHALDGRVFPVTTSAFTSAWKRARAKAGLEFFRFHDTRHEMASRLSENDWDVMLIMQQGDWRDVKSVKRYVNLRGKSLGSKLAQLRR